MTLEEMLTILHDRTKVFNNDPMLIGELNSALDEVWNRMYLATGGEQQLMYRTFGVFENDTEWFEWRLAIEPGAAGNIYYAMKKLWIKGAGESGGYTPVRVMDIDDPEFEAYDREDAPGPPYPPSRPPQVIHPVRTAFINESDTRFAPPLPAGTMWRADWVGRPRPFSLATAVETYMPDTMHWAVLDRATANVFNILDDSREAIWLRHAESRMVSAIHALKRRQNQEVLGTIPYPRRGRGY